MQKLSDSIKGLEQEAKKKDAEISAARSAADLERASSSKVPHLLGEY